MNLFPKILRYALKPLADETNQTIISYIILRGRAKPRELVKALSLDKERLGQHLKELTIGNIVSRRFDEKLEEYYVLTPLARRLIYNMLQSYEG